MSGEDAPETVGMMCLQLHTWSACKKAVLNAIISEKARCLKVQYQNDLTHDSVVGRRFLGFLR